ncbi:unnamed protein product [Echinostoma caproni]|uniref:Laminin N-terminal domain-containing protein n=1 Tax=Echinostoma caproni TaxID=27848 RepID=A0A183AU61_9TREM|nr:unnamed protein product [Echinostoma caproni]
MTCSCDWAPHVPAEVPRLPIQLSLTMKYFRSTGGTLAGGGRCIDRQYNFICTPVFRVCLTSEAQRRNCEQVYEFGGHGPMYYLAKSIDFGDHLEPDLPNMLNFTITRPDAVLHFTVSNRDFRLMNLWSEFEVPLQEYLTIPSVITENHWTEKLQQSNGIQ